ncbi:histone deacetylase 6 isoform X2 [Scleropages formosus]|uniref:histone deacetylase 6 isoform X2 n=1 Tax=Scleropages formosus TaxID=113540 RepID=UPI000878893C|nr:histone deacetylase 6 isoform X2 [Scleropages formosus]
MDSTPDPSGSKSPRGSTHSSRSPDSAPKKSTKPSSKKSNLKEVRKKGRMDRSRGEEEMSNQLKSLDLHGKPRPTGTGLVFSDIFTHHRCLWDSCHSENPERVVTILEKVKQEGLFSRCVEVEARSAVEEDLLLVHKREYVELMKSTQNMTESKLRTLSDTYDSVYLHPESFLCATMAVGSILQLVDKVMSSELQNGFCVVRPPGHHAHVDMANGYCLFNNLAIAARYAQKQYGLERVLIVDWDVHHGQGIQYIFQEDPSVLYFSVHRYEEGTFWPHLPESDSSAVGTGAGKGYNINLPWNKIKMADGDYIAAFQQLLLPVAYEFEPQLVLVAAGFDSVVGDPKGEMSTSPQCFAVLTHLLQGLAQGRLVLALEGGYNLESTAEGVCACLRSLLGDPCPQLNAPVTPCESALKSISQTISSLYPFWTSLQILEGGPLPGGHATPTAMLQKPHQCPWESASPLTGLVYDERMMEHHNMWDSHHPELPQRISRIFSRHEDLGLVCRCHRIPARLATEEELALCHSLEHIAKIKSSEEMKPRDLHKLGGEYNSIYISPESYKCALLAAGSCFNSAQAILTGQVKNAVAIVRPPGHHAERDIACGFCLFNNAALTARYAQKLAKTPLRVLILDWDVHHGNGIQHVFEEDDSVLYISLHRYDNGQIFPFSEDANYDRVGRGKGLGFNVNIPWSGSKMGDSEYLAAFHMVVMPIARQFDPELVLVSAGFDAARGDPLGGYKVTPEGYAHMTRLLMSLAGGRVMLILEGGYNLTSISDSMSMCTSMLLGDTPPSLSQLLPPHPEAALIINRVLHTHAPYWSGLRIQIPEYLPSSVPSHKQKNKRPSAGRGKNPKQATPAGSPAQRSLPVTPGPVAGGSPEKDEELEGIAQGLRSLDLDTVSSSSSPTSVPVGGGRRKVKPKPQDSPAPQVHVTPEKKENEDNSLQHDKTGVMPVKESALDTVATGDVQTGELGEASGWTKSVEHQTVFELFSRGQDIEGGTLYVVDPLPWCPHLEVVRPVPPGGIDVFLPCEDCGTDTENWICLVCYKVFCGRYVNQHMVSHGQVLEHPLVLSFSDLSVWCYRCESYVHNKVLHEAKNAAHQMKFGEDIPCVP